MQINDNIIQGLTAAVMAAEAGRHTVAEVFLQRTLEAARRMMADLLVDLDRPPQTATAERSASGIGVLVVDDAIDLRLLFRRALERDGAFTVLGEAGDGLEAIEQARLLKPQVILLDVAMPTLDGISALPQIREAAPEAVIIVLSGFGAHQMDAKALEAGADAYLEKGVATPDIVEVIMKHLPQPGSAPTG